MNKNRISKHYLILFLTIIAFGFTSIPPECGPGADPQLSYDGNWDMHVGGCWTPPEPRTCVYCEYL